MNESIKEELKNYLIGFVNGRYDDNQTNFEDLHHEAFNEDYYIIGYYQANQWLKMHDVDAFEAIAYVIEQEQSNFGESNIKPEDINSEKIVNLLVYFAAYEIMPNVDLSDTTKAEILECLENN